MAPTGVTVSQVGLLLALLALTSQAGAVGALVSRRIRVELAPYALPLAWAVASTATLGSLYFSEIADFPPCRLCWYQRIAMYPLSLVLGIAAWRRDPAVRRYAAPLAVIGALVAGYHILVERFPSLEASSCDPLNPCSIIWVERFGYVTIPVMALSGFAFILALLAASGGARPTPRGD